ncbi:MAG: YitT family protein [Firmicutes bacterium]|nr:YitT family protein [Bacillota bacterium]
MQRARRILGAVALVLLGTGISAIAYTQLIIPNRMLSGGVGGLSILINRLTGWPTGTLVFLINLPILYLGYRKIGGKFIALTIIAVINFSFLLDIIPVRAAVDDLLLASVFGGALNGLGLALVLKAGGSTGGTDVIGVILNRRYYLSIGEVLLAFNGLIVLASALIFDLMGALYTLITMFVTSRAVDSLQNVRDRKTALIVTSKHDEIAKQIHRRLQRGVTFLQGEGSYQHGQRKVILCVLTRFEISELKDIVLKEDPHAFMTISDTSEVLGRFEPYSPFRRAGSSS